MIKDGVIKIDTSEGLMQAFEEKKFDVFKVLPDTHPALHQVLPEFDFSKPPVEPNWFASSLVETCRAYNGMGLSANQCGYNHRVFVMGSGENFVAFYNPKIVKTEGETVMEEGCLSFPLLTFKIKRAEQIWVEYQDFTGAKKEAHYIGLTARCFQHELDHMNGIVYTSKVKPLAMQMALKKRAKIMKKYTRFNKNDGNTN
jgi:peptide deformylase